VHKRRPEVKSELEEVKKPTDKKRARRK